MRFGEPFKNTPISLDFPNNLDLRGWILVLVEIFPPVPCPILVLGVPNSPQFWPPVNLNGSTHDLYRYLEPKTPEGPRTGNLRGHWPDLSKEVENCFPWLKSTQFLQKEKSQKIIEYLKRGIPTTKSPKSSDVHPQQIRRLRGWLIVSLCCKH